VNSGAIACQERLHDPATANVKNFAIIETRTNSNIPRYITLSQYKIINRGVLCPLEKWKWQKKKRKGNVILSRDG